jgi:signal transduction histidine kinase
MRSLRSRLTLTHILVALVAVVVVAGLTSWLIQRGFDNLADTQALSEAEDLADRTGEFYARRGSWRGIELAFRRRYPVLRAGDPIQRRQVQIVDERGTVVFDSLSPGASRKQELIRNAVAAPIDVDGQTVGRVLVGSPRQQLTSAERDFLMRVRLSVLIGSVTAVTLALLVGLFSAARVTRPLQSLTAAARQLAAGARHEPLAVPADRELAEMAIAFNTMAAELEHQQILRRQQVADIAHELRTPLSVLRLQIESLEDGVEQPTPALLGSLTEEVGLLNRLVDDLRLLSLADAGQLNLRLEAVDAGDALRQASASASARARQQGIALVVEPPEAGLLAQADMQRLAQVLGNLVENALRYTPNGGRVTISASALAEPPAAQPAAPPRGRFSTRPLAGPAAQRRSVVFTISDTGPGIPPEDLARIFERFWRADRARARETGGSGLGLAIVQRLVELQGGRVWATSQVGQGTTFHVALPAAAPPQPAGAAPRP